MGLLAMAAAAATLVWSPAPGLQSRLDTARVAAHAPGASAAVVRDGQVVWSGASGLAVTRRGVDARTGRRTARRAVRATPGTRFSVASLSKMYTATLVMRLVQDGRVGLDDPISRWVPSYVPARDRVTVRMLLAHTSGYPDVEDRDPLLTRLDIADRAWNPNHRWTRAELMRLTRAPHFRPGSRYEYSNTNYLLLGAILERAGGASVPAQLDQAVAPLGVHDTFYADAPGLAGTMAHGYEAFDGALNDHWAQARGVPTDIVGPVWTDGGIVTTAADAARFAAALNGGRILDAPTLATMLAPTRKGRSEGYGLGTFRERIAGRTWQGHDGAYGGYESMAFTDRARGLSLAVLVNVDSDNPDADPAGDIFAALARALRGV